MITIDKQFHDALANKCEASEDFQNWKRKSTTKEPDDEFLIELFRMMASTRSRTGGTEQ